MKLLLKTLTILILGVAFSGENSFAFQSQSAKNIEQRQEFKKVDSLGVNAALLEHSRTLSPIHVETLPLSVPALFTFISFISLTSYVSVTTYQKKIKFLIQRWLWLILFPFHSFD